MMDRPGKFNGANVPWRMIVGIEKSDCPCIKADDERIARVEAACEAAEDEEESVRLRVLAIEKAVWGETFEGSLSTDRPRIRKQTDSEECDEVPPSSDKKRRVD